MSSDWLGALSRQNHSVGRAAPARLRNAESAALTGALRRFYEAERPLPLLWRVDFRRSAAAGWTPVGLARGFPAGFFCGTNRALRRRFGARISGGTRSWQSDFEALNPLMYFIIEHKEDLSWKRFAWPSWARATLPRARTFRRIRSGTIWRSSRLRTGTSSARRTRRRSSASRRRSRTCSPTWTATTWTSACGTVRTPTAPSRRPPRARTFCAKSPWPTTLRTR